MIYSNFRRSDKSTNFTQYVTDWLPNPSNEDMTIDFRTVSITSENKQYAPNSRSGNEYYNVFTFGSKTRCHQVAYEPFNHTGEFYIRLQHDGYVYGWFKYTAGDFSSLRDALINDYGTDPSKGLYNLPSGTNLDNIKYTGFYRCNNVIASGVSNNFYGTAIVINGVGEECNQIIFNNTSTESIFARYYRNSSWSSFDRLSGLSNSSRYGRVKLSDNYKSNEGNSANSLAPSQTALYNLYTEFTRRLSKSYYMQENANQITIRFSAVKSSADLPCLISISGDLAYVNIKFANLADNLSSSGCIYTMLSSKDNNISSIQACDEGGKGTTTLIRVFLRSDNPKSVTVFPLSATINEYYVTNISIN